MASKIAKESVTGINNAEALQGWQSYGPWAYALDGPTFGYLLDEKLRVYSHVGELGNSILRSKPYAAKIEMLKDTPGVDRMGQPYQDLGDD